MSETENREMTDETQAEEMSQEEMAQRAEELMNELSCGTLRLIRPFVADDKTITELKYDIGALTGIEMTDALDKAAPKNRPSNAFSITSRQGLELFVVSAAKMNKGVDAGDIKRGLSAADSVKAAQIGQLFFVTASQTANGNISKA